MSESELQDAWQSHRAGDHARAERLYKDILHREPRNLAALYRLGFLYGERGRFKEAEGLMGEAIALNPRAANAHVLRGYALMQLARFEEAVACFGHALALNPNVPDVLLNRAAALFRLKRYAEAGEDYERLLRLDPEYPYARGNRLFCRLHGCDWRNFTEEAAAIAAGLREGKRVVVPFDAKALSLTAADELRCASIWTEDQAPAAPIALYGGEPYRHDRIRVAYLAETFGDDPVSSLIVGVIESHDRRRFEIVGVTFRASETSLLHDRFARAFEKRVDGAGRGDLELASLLRGMEIDIAVDLMGYTQGCRPGVFAARPAPVQVNYLGFPGTMAASYIDYILADRIVIPEDERRHYSERVVYLPGSYLCSDSTRAVGSRAPCRAEAGLPEKGFVFASFNNTYKFAPKMFDIWMRLLHAVDGSVLWLPKSNAVALGNLSREAEARGIDPARLVFAPFVPNLQDHLARLSLADLFLDTLPYNAHSTAVDALSAGLPVLTCEGKTFAGRVAASLLHTVGIPETIARSLEEYEALALKLAEDRDELARIRTKLALNRKSSMLCDPARFARNLEAAYAEMWERAERKLPPEGFAVAERP
jgi:predicted O-linked N-acetylglucosamine transferase (SPINDLY family)